MSGNLFQTIVDRIEDEDDVFLDVPGHARYSYRDMIEWSGRYANVLAAHGVTKGDRVAV